MVQLHTNFEVEWVLQVRVVTKKTISEKCRKYLPNIYIQFEITNQFRSVREELLSPLLVLPNKLHHLHIQVGHSANFKWLQWLRSQTNGLEIHWKSLLNKEKKSGTEQFFLDPRFIASEYIAVLCPPCLFFCSFLIFPLISYTSSFLFRELKHVFHLQHFLFLRWMSFWGWFKKKKNHC